jgi:hypothetical protein
MRVLSFGLKIGSKSPEDVTRSLCRFIEKSKKSVVIAESCVEDHKSVLYRSDVQTALFNARMKGVEVNEKKAPK